MAKMGFLAKIGMITIIFVIIISGLMIFFKEPTMKVWDFGNNIVNKIRGIQLQTDQPPESMFQQLQVSIIQPPAEAASFCTVQQYQVCTDPSCVVSDGIVGWDSINHCCVLETTGFDACVNKQVTDRLCTTGIVNGAITYFTIDGYQVGDSTEYQGYKSNLHKTSGFSCNGLVYPTAVNNQAVIT